MAQIAVTRGTRKWPDLLRAYKVMIDGRVAGSVRQGETITTSIEPGLHHVRMEIDWCGSSTVALDIERDETVRLVCTNSTPVLLLPIYIFFRPGQYLSLDKA